MSAPKGRGRVPAPPDGPEAAAYGVLAHQPALLRAFQRLYGTLWSHGVLDPPTKEVARIRNARTIDCRYCRNVRFAAAREQGLDEEDVELVADGWEGTALRERHKLAIRWTDAFLGDPAAVDAGLRGRMLREFTPDELVELTAGLALFLGFAKIAVALGQQPDAMPVTVLATPDRPT
jgi:AhpD family alkylhydroperoxidase